MGSGNLWAVVELKLHPGQEAFVADNIDSIANASVEPTFVPLAIYAGDELVGFAMYGQHPPDTGTWWVIRLMIDREHQGKGYGRAAMEAVIAMMADRVGCEEIVTSFNPANAAAATPLHLARVSAHRRDRGRRAAAAVCGSPIVAQIGTRDGRLLRDPSGDRHRRAPRRRADAAMCCCRGIMKPVLGTDLRRCGLG